MPHERGSKKREWIGFGVTPPGAEFFASYWRHAGAMIGVMTDFEKLGVFYLGKGVDGVTGKATDVPLLYDARDLTTHALCVGMTGSGKPGLCIALLEEAAIDGIPAIAIDPKGDLANLLLTFPNLAGDDFAPWIDPAEAARQGVTVEQLAEKTARAWKDGLGSFGQSPERIGRFTDAAERVVYTPGSNSGVPISVLKSFSAPPKALIDDADLLRERIAGAASGLLTLLGMLNELFGWLNIVLRQKITLFCRHQKRLSI